MIKNRGFYLKVMMLFSILAVPVVQAHSVYFEETENGLVIRFGEFQGDHEESPGYLDQLSSVNAWTLEKEGKLKYLTATKVKQGFTLDVSANESIVAQTAFPVMARDNNPGRKPNFYARWIPNFTSKIDPSMNLDITPIGVIGKVQVSFRGQPLPNTDATLYFPDATEQKYTSDIKGIINFKINPKVTGIYMLKVARYSEELKGFDRGVGYAVISHNCSLTWRHK